MRIQDITNAANLTKLALRGTFSLKTWDGETFNVAMISLHKCPWGSLETLSKKVLDFLFQMLLRGSNVVGYTNYPDNLVHKFCKHASRSGVDIFRVFDSLNYTENLKLGIGAAGSACEFVESTLYYMGRVSYPNKVNYDLEY